ncbi:histidine kinase [Hymenobacter glaciei]|uniref:Histidine kinase n=1 Tax=Hymenobacter glaciei TaxID=877209 RepID=A0ABP7U1U0_9BACT
MTLPPLPAASSRFWLRRVLRDGLAWLPIIALYVVAYHAQKSSVYNGHMLAVLVVALLPWILGVYGNHLVLVPRLFDQGRYFAYFGALVGWVLVLHAVARGLGWLLLPQEAWASKAPWFMPGGNIFGQLLLALPFLFMWRTVTGRRQAQRTQLLAQEQQLRLLEAQVNPHFLFNTLNSLYALSLAQSPRTPDLLLALAQLMRYQLESTLRAQVPLAEELDYLRSYAQLQEMRLGPRCPVQVALPTEEEAAGRTIAPLLLLALVENAFTYGTRRASGSFVHLRIGLAGPRLSLSIRNALPPASQAEGGTGTGLPNTTQRLALLYPGRHYLRAAPTETEFQTDLTIDL